MVLLSQKNSLFHPQNVAKAKKNRYYFSHEKGIKEKLIKLFTTIRRVVKLSFSKEYSLYCIDGVFSRTFQLLYHKFGNMVIFLSRNLYSLCSPGNQHYQKIIYSLIFSSKKVEIGDQNSIIKNI